MDAYLTLGAVFAYNKALLTGAFLFGARYEKQYFICGGGFGCGMAWR